MSDFHINKLTPLGDVARSYLFEINIPNIEQLDQADMLIRAKTASIPGKTAEPLEVFFKGMKKKIPGKVQSTDTVEFSFVEYDDFKVSKAFNSWMNSIFDIEKTGLASTNIIKDLQKNVEIVMFNVAGDRIASVMLHNAWPSAIADVSLAYDGAESILQSITMTCDFTVFGD